MLARVLLATIVLGGVAAPAAAQGTSSFEHSDPMPNRPPKAAALVSPLDLVTSDGFNLATFTPPFQGAYLLAPREATLYTRWHVGRTAIGSASDAYRFRGTLRELRVVGTIGLSDLGAPVELQFGLSLAALSGSQRHISANFAQPDPVTATLIETPVLPNGWRESPALRHGWFGLRLAVFEAREFDLRIATSGWVKLPIDGEKHMLDTGEIEAGALLHLSYALRVGRGDIATPNVYLHLMGGGMWRRDQKVFATRVRPQPGAVYAGALVVRLERWPIAAVFQVRGNVNGWQELKGFSSDPLNVQVGLRGWLPVQVIYEAGVSFGLTDESSQEWSVELAAGVRF